MTGRGLAALMGAIALAGSAPAQVVNGVSAGNAPEAAASVPEDEGGKAADRGGLAARGGEALQSRRTFQSAIRTEIYTPTYTSMFTPVQRPPDSTSPR